MRKKVVIALGGNALGDTPKSQKEAVEIAAHSIVELIKQDLNVMVVHGNGPQVGMIHLAFNKANTIDDHIPLMPFVEATAMSQGYIGYHLQNALVNALNKESIDREVVTLLTQVVVDEQDAAFTHPTKPVGPFYSKEAAEHLSKIENVPFVEDAGRGYRKVVPSPKPITVVETNAIKQFMDLGYVVISNGGGGIPTLHKNNQYEGVEAVIDKDFAAAKIAQEIDADTLVILTAVPKVAINFGKENQAWLDTLSITQAKAYIEEGHFAPGSMLPKVEACISFVENNPSKKAMITSLENASNALKNGDATIITMDS